MENIEEINKDIAVLSEKVSIATAALSESKAPDNNEIGITSNTINLSESQIKPIVEETTVKEEEVETINKALSGYYMDVANVCLSNNRLLGFTWSDDIYKKSDGSVVESKFSFNSCFGCQVSSFKGFVDYLHKIKVSSVKVMNKEFNKYALKVNDNDTLSEYWAIFPKVTFRIDGVKELYLDCDVKVSVEYLYNFFKSLSKDDLKGDMVVYMSQDYLLLIEIKGLYWLVAPRVDND